MALPLLPVHDVERAYEELTGKMPVELEDLFEYFDGWWMKQVPIGLWNVSSLESRTNNNVECKYLCSCHPDLVFFLTAWHSRFNKRIEKKHPNIWAFIEVVKNEEVHFKRQMIHANSGKLKKVSEKTCMMQQKLDVLGKRYREGVIKLSEYHYQLSLLIGAKSK
jgi:hypothetical protein